ncbi:uncharacterized protein LOC110978131 [Acanthaster planci]|uniref:Uncharacterized protein LOC110978131 n=1 Tax=Acanthaster planci TaxID=133434 RepID=A0A8B7Y5U1_ACAPL|nr:uncharacterized protein LOC110978131 [Acanthaster planci]
MSHFNLTHLGYQDPIREKVLQPNPEYRYQLVQDVPKGSYVTFRPPASKLPPIDMHKYNKVIQPGKYEEHGGSYVKFTERLHKHTRTNSAPNEIYRTEITTSMKPGWWSRNDNIHQREPWTHTPRRVLVNSEMTRFVNEMSLTNREFSLF